MDSLENADSGAPLPLENFDIGEKLTHRLNEYIQQRQRTQHQIDQGSAQLQNLIKTTPKRPRDSKSTLHEKIKHLERDRTARSLPLSKEKTLINQINAAQKTIRQHDECDSHHELIRRKREEIDTARDELRTINSDIHEIEKVLATVVLAKSLGCSPAELITREVLCPVEKMSTLIGVNGEIITAIERSEDVHIQIDKIHGKIILKGQKNSVMKVVEQVEDFVSAIDLEVSVSPDEMAYLISRTSSVFEEIKKANPGVNFTALARMNRITLHGSPDKVQKAKLDLTNISIISKSQSLDSREIALVVGKAGSTINSLSEKHNVLMEVEKENESASLRVIGFSENVDTALLDVKMLLFENELIEENISVDSLVKGELLNNSGAGMKEFQNSVSHAVGSDNGVLLFLDKSAPKDAPVLLLKCKRSEMDRAKSLVLRKINEFESKIIKVHVPVDILPAVIGKGGAKINSLRQEGVGATVVADKLGLVKIYSNDSDTSAAVKCAVEKIIAENQVGHVTIENKSFLGFLFGELGKEVMTQIAEIGCNVSSNDDDSKLILRGTEEQIELSTDVLKTFIANNHFAELSIDPDDEPLLFIGGANSILNTVETNHGVKAIYRRDTGTVHIRGQVDSVNAAKKDIEVFVCGGDGNTVCKFKVPEEAIGMIVGKAGSNLSKLESDFQGIRIHIPKDKNTVSIRGPDDLVKKCKIRLMTDVATLRVHETFSLTPEQHSQLLNSDVIKNFATVTNTSIVLIENAVKIRGVGHDVRDAKTLFNEYFYGVYDGFIDLDESQCVRLRNIITKDSSHFEQVKVSHLVDISLDESECFIKITGKRSNVKKAKISVNRFLDFMFPHQIQAVKVPKILYRTIGDPDKLGEVAAATGTSIYLDRDFVSVVIRSINEEDATKAFDLITARLAEIEKLNYIFQLESSESWLLPVIIGKGGINVKKFEAETGCHVDTNEDLTVVIRGESEEIVEVGKNTLLQMINQAKKENVFIDIPESAIPAFIGKGGEHIKQLSSEYHVEIERMKKHSSTMKITGEELNVSNAKRAVLTWLRNWEVSHIGLTITVEEQLIPAILGRGGEKVKAIQKETGCRVDVDKLNATLTVRGGSEASREEAIRRIKKTIDEENTKAAERAAEKKKLRQEQIENAQVQAKSMPDSSNALLKETVVAENSGIKDRSKEFLANPVGLAKNTLKENSMNDSNETVTKEGKDLYHLLISGDEESNRPINRWDTPTEDNSSAAIVECNTNDGGKAFYYRSISGFAVRI